MVFQYNSPNEERLHLQAMQQIARESGDNLQRIRQIYEGELSRLQADARIRDYLILLTARRVREALARREGGARFELFH